MAITKYQIDNVEAEIERFSRRVRELRAVLPDSFEHDTPVTWEHPRETGALKRASLDLTRALADLRRSPYGR